MAEDPPKAAAPVVLRIKVRYQEVDAFVERFAPYVARAGLFLRSKAPKPVGTEVRFELRLGNDQPVLVGMGLVRWSRAPDPDKPYSPPGMAIEFTRVTKESRGVILKMLELRRTLGMTDGPRGLPNPPDDDVAVIAATTAAATATAIAAEMEAAAAGQLLTTGPTVAVIASETAPVPVPAVPEPSASWQRPPAPGTLDPVVTKPRRPSAAELVATMSGPSATLTGMADAFGEIDVADSELPGVLARARAMVGHDLDGELANLLEQAAAPIEISIDEASAGLASLFGTAPVSTRTRRPRGDDSVPTLSRPAFSAPPPVAAPAPVVVSASAVAAAAAEIASDFLAPEPADTNVDGEAALAAQAEAEALAEATAAVAAAAASDAIPRPSSYGDSARTEFDEPAVDPERTRVVSLEGMAALTAVPPPGATRVVNLEALAAASAIRDGDERTRVVRTPDERPGEDEERTRIVPIPVADDARTRVLSARQIEDAAIDDVDDTLDFDRPRKVPRDFADEPEVSTSVRMRPLPPSIEPGRAPPARLARRTSPPPPPGRRLPPEPPVRAVPPPHAPIGDDDESHDEDLTPPPVDTPDPPTNAIDLRAHRAPSPSPARLPRAESSDSIDLSDLVAELEAEAAAPVPLARALSAAAAPDGLGRSLGGEALDADGLIADLDGMGRRRAPDGPFPDLASFADPPSQLPRRERADSLEAALAALELGEDDGPDASEERTSAERPASHPGIRPSPASAEDDDDEVEIEIEMDD